MEGQWRRRQRYIIHLSGSAGAGKTTLGEQLAAHYGEDRLIVKDTDELADRIVGAKPQEFVASLREAVVAWIKSVDDGHHDILLVGIMDITDADAGKTHMVDMKTVATHRFFMSIASDRLLQQFYCRFARHANDAGFWADVADNRKRVPSSSEVLNMDRLARTLHDAAGYEVVTPMQFVHQLEALLLF